MNHRLRAVTLTELAFALMIISIGVTASMAIFPIALRSQQQARYQVLAAAQVQALTHMLSQSYDVWWGGEGQQVQDRPWTNSTARMPDLEGAYATSYMGAFLPVPTVIAQRFDSDGDEIGQVLAEGANLYYPLPAGQAMSLSSGLLEMDSIGSESFKLVMAIRGAPQQNALVYHPQIKWPYVDHYPSDYAASIMGGELAVLQKAQSDLGLTATWLGQATSNNLDQLKQALAAVGLDIDAQVTAGNPPPDKNALDLAYGNDQDGPDALRFNVRTLLLRWYTYQAGEAAKPSASGPDLGHWPQGYPDSNPDIRRFQIAHAWMLAHIMYLQVQRPYDWRVPRHYQNHLFTDAPLLQYDLTAPAVTDPANGGTMHAWRLLSSRPITAAGSHTFPSAVIDKGQRTPGDGWNLTKPFAASERIREVVFWAVDWQAYEDFEEAPSAPQDASLFPFLPRQNRGTAWSAADPGFATVSYASQSGWGETPLAWTDASRSKTLYQMNDPALGRGWNWMFNGTVMGSQFVNSYLGRSGADRNGNGRFDRGTVKKSQRMRAMTVARFLVYDPRGWIQER